MAIIPAFTINGFTRPELHTDTAGNIVLDPVAASFAATYGIKALYLGVPAGTPYPPVPASLTSPSDTNTTANLVAEGAANGTAVGLTALATNTSGQPVSYTLTDNAGGRFAINSTTGVVTVANGSLIDYENNPSHSYSITVQANDGILTTSRSFAIAVGDVNDIAPVFTSGTSATTPENVATTTAVYTAHATDADGTALNNTVHYSLASGGDNDLFNIDANTGAVRFKASPNFEVPQDQGANNVYDITVVASDGVPAHDVSRNVAITVTDLNDTPTITSDGGGDAASVNVVENTTAVTTVTATDADIPPQALVYSIVTGTDSPDAAKFIIDGAGHLAFVSAPNFEAPGSAANSNTYTVQVRATDNGNPSMADVQTITVNVQNVNEAPAGADKTVSTTEDTPYVFSVADFGFTDPSDSSAPNSLLAVFINNVPGAGAGTLTNNGNPVNPGDSISATDIAAGHLVFTPALDANGSPVATFSFQVRDDGGTANGGVDIDFPPNTITVDVTAVNDAPTAPSLTQSLIIDEDAAATSLFGAPLSPVADIDSTNVTATLTLVNPAAGVLTGGNFAATGNPGEYSFTGTSVDVSAALNGVMFDSADEFSGSTSVNVMISDGANGPQGVNPTGTVSITVNAVNDAPTATNLTQLLTINEDAAPTTLFTLPPVVSDVDSTNVTARLVLSPTAGELTGGGFALTGNPGEYSFSGTPAEVTAALAAVKFDSADNFNAATFVNVFISDGLNGPQGGNPVGAVQITVNAVNDAPTATGLTQSLIIDEDAAATSLFGAPLSPVTDIDSGNVTATLTLVNPAAGVLTGGGFTATGNPGEYSFTGTSVDVSAALNGVQFDSADEFSGSTSVNVVISDGANGPQGANPTGTVSITVNAVNDAPTATNLTQLLTINEDAAPTTLFTLPPVVSDIDSTNVTARLVLSPTAGVLTGGGFALTGTPGEYSFSGTPAEVTAALAAVKFDSADNFNAATFVNLFISDGLNGPQGGNPVGAVQITVNAVNDAPTATNLSQSLMINEDDAATTLFTAAPVVADIDSPSVTATLTLDAAAGTLNNAGAGALANGVLTYTITGTAAQVNGALASVTYDSAQDFFGTSSVGVTISDGAGGPQGLPEPTGSVSVTVNPVNDAPTLAATANNPAYTGTPVVLFSGVSASTVESGQLIDQLVLTVTNISGTATDSLTIDGTLIALTDGNSLSTTTPGVTASVVVAGNIATVTITSIPGLSGTDMATLVDGLIYTDTNVSLGDPARVVTITSMHDTGGTTPGVDTATLNITSTVNFDIAPIVVAGHTLNYTENQAATAFDPAITVTDSDNANLVSATVQISANYISGQDVLGFTSQNGISGSFNATTGTLTLTGSSTVANYQAALASVTYVNTSDNPSGAARTVTITTNDGILNSAPVTDTINVTPVNDAPVAVAGHTLAYTENQAATAIDPAIAVSDVDNANLASATVQISANYVNGQDVLGFTTQNGITGSFNAANGTLTLTGSSSVANYQAALASVTYVNTSDNPSGAARTVTIITNDGTANSVAVIDTINVTPVNDAPVSTAGGTLNYTENQVATAIDSSVTLSDVDNTNLSSATVQITGNYANGQDILGFTMQNGITGSFVAATGTLTLSGSSSVANYQTALDSVTYFNNSDNPSGLDRTVTYTANDGAPNSNSSTSTIHVTPVNDAPVVNATGALNFTENQAATAIAPALTLSDADTTTLTTATVHISANYAPSEDVLAFTNQNGITGSYDAGTGTLTLTGSASVANYQTALASVTYVNTSDAPSTSARTVTFTADDGQGVNHLSAGSNHIINVAAVDDAPTASVPTDASIGTAFSHTNLAISGLSVNDIDSGAGNVTATISSGNAGLTFTTAGLASSTGNGTHTVTLTGTVAQVNSALSSLLYNSDDGFTGSDTVTLSVSDNGNTGSGGPLGSGNQTFHVGVIPQVFVIDNTPAGAGNDGSLANPFSSIASFNANAADGSGDYVYVNSGTYSEADGINLVAGEHLFGQGQTLAFTNPVTGQVVTIGTGSAGATPIISVNGASQHGIDLASNNEVTGINVTTTLGNQIGIHDSGASVGNLLMSNVDVTGSGQAVNITHGGALNVVIDTLSSSGGATGVALGGALTGNFTGTTGTLSGHTTSEFDVNGGTGNISYGGVINEGTGLSASVASHTGGTVTFSGLITDGSDAGGGIALSSNTGGTVNFSGGMTLNTGASNAFSASGGGTVNVTGANNHITTTTGTALNISNTTIGASNVTFHDVSANGGANGIVLDNTGSTGGFHLTGNGTNVGATGGGVIQNMAGGDGTTSGIGIYLNNTHDVQLNGLQLNGFSNFGVRGLSVDGVALTNTTISGLSGNNNLFDEAAVAFGTTGGTTGITGTGTFTNLNVRGGFENNLQFFQTSGTSNLTFTNLDSHDTKNDSPSFGADGFLLETQSSANSTVLIQGSDFSNNFTQGIQANALDTSTLNMTVRSSTFSNNNEGVVLANNGSGHLTATVGGNTAADGNTVTGSIGVGIFVGNGTTLTTNAMLIGAIRHNTVTQANGHNNDAIRSLISGPATASPSTVLDISNNVATTPANTNGGTGFRGIFVDTPDPGSSPTFDVTVNNNTATTAGLGANAIALQARFGNGDFHVQGNSATATNADGIFLRQVNSGFFDLERGISASSDPTQIIKDNNPAVTGGAPHTILVLGTVNPVANGAVTTVPLLASAGGVVSALNSGGEYHLSQLDLNTVVQAAIARWDAAGLSADQLSHLHNLSFTVADMDGAALGVSSPGGIKIDSDGGSYGWFVDTTPQGDTEFGHAAGATHLTTDPTEAAAGHMDLLTTVMHEMGHQLGLEDSYAAGDRGDLMFGFLTTGERRLPDSTDVVQANASGALQAEAALPLSAQAGVGTPIVVGTAGNDTIDAGHGGNILVGGAGADNFVFANVEIHTTTPWSLISALWGAPPVTPPALTHVADYSFAQGDSFDFSALTSAFHGSWASDAQIVRAVEDPSGTFATLQVNASGPSIGSWFNMLLQGNANGPSNNTASWVDVAQLDGAHAGDDVSVLIDSHTVHLAQVHVGLLV